MLKLRDFNMVLLTDVLSKSFTALALLALVRVLNPDDLANFVFASASASAAYSFFNGFFNRQLIFDREFLPHARILQYVAVLLVALAYAVIWIFSSSLHGWNLALGGLAFSMSAMLYDFRRSCFQRVGLFRPFAAMELARAILFLVSTISVLLLMKAERAWVILLAQAAGFLLVAVAAPLRNLPRERVSLSGFVSSFRHLASLSNLQLLCFFILVGLLGQLPALLYRPIATTLEYASFGSAFRYYGLLVAIAAAVNAVSMPAIASAEAADRPALIRSLALMSAISVALVISAVVAGFVIMPIVDGGKYPAAPIEFAVLASGVMFGVMLGPVVSLYLRRGKVKALLLSQACAVSASAALILLGAATSSLAVAAAIPLGVAIQLGLLAIPLLNREQFGRALGQ